MITIGTKIDEIRIDGNLQNFRSDLEKFAALKLEAVEIPVHGLDAIKNGVLDRRRVENILGILRDFDFRYSVHSPNPLNLMEEGSFAKHYSVFQASLEFTAEIGTRVLVYHAGRFLPEETFCLPLIPQRDPDRERRLLEQEKGALQKLAEEFPGVVIAVENARPYLFHSPYCYAEKLDSMKEVVQAVNRPNVQITLDIGHLYMAAQFYSFDPVKVVRSINELIAHTHVHDNFGGAIYYNEKIQTHQIPLGRGDAHMPVGWGEIPIALILSAYLRSHSGLMILELRNRYFNHLQKSKANLVQLLNSLTSESPLRSGVSLGPSAAG